MDSELLEIASQKTMDKQVKEHRSLRLIRLLKEGYSYKEALEELDIEPATVLYWKRKRPKFAMMLDECIQAKEALIYSEALEAINRLAKEGNIEALKLLTKQVQASARKLGHSGSDVKQSSINIDASDNRRINLSSMLSDSTVEKLKLLKPVENTAVRIVEGVGGKVSE
jgi:hypothetical protein